MEKNIGTLSKYINAFRQLFSSGGDGAVFLFSVIGIAIAASVLSNFFVSVLFSIVQFIFSKTKNKVDKTDLEPIKKPLKILFVATITYLSVYILGTIRIEKHSNYIVVLMFAKHVYRIIMILLIFILVYKLIPTLIALYQRFNKTENITRNPAVSGFIIRMLQLLAVILCFIIILSEIGINVNGLITGLGLGGLTFALAAQDTASNIFGGVVILSDKPFSVGEWIQTPDVDGVVEDISFRSTRIRTFDDALVVLPNSKLTNTAITNWTKMNKRRIRFHVGLTYSTKPDTLRSIIDEIRYFLKNHPEIISDSVIVRLENFAPSALNILVHLYVSVTTLDELKRIHEEINFSIMDIVANNNSSFAFPSTSIYMENQEK